MKPSSVGRVLLILFFLSPCSTTFSQQSNSTAIPLESLKSPDWEHREAAFEKIRNDQKVLKRSDVEAALVDLLDGENQMIHKLLVDSNGRVGISTKYGEGYGEYVANLVDTVKEIVDWRNPHQLCILAQSSYSPGTTFARELAAKGGIAIVPCLLNMEQGKMYGQQDSIDVRMYDRDKAIPVLVELSAVTKDLSPLLRQQIQEAAIEGLHDSNGLVRRDAIEAVSQFGTLEMIPFLEDIARADPYSRVKDGKQFFPRREAAAKAIRSIQERAVKAPTP